MQRPDLSRRLFHLDGYSISTTPGSYFAVHWAGQLAVLRRHVAGKTRR